jgi:hypothetical protein
MVNTDPDIVMDIHHLLSTPESAVRDEFDYPSPPQLAVMTMSHGDRLMPDRKTMASSYPNSGQAAGGPLSPPVTPGKRHPEDERKPFSDHDYARHSDRPSEARSVCHDPILYPIEPTELHPSQSLFAAPEPTRLTDTSNHCIDDLVSQHIAMHMASYVNCLSKPTRDEYLLAASCVPAVSTRYAQNPTKWYRQEQRILHERFGQANRARKRSSTEGKTLAKLAPAPAGSGIKIAPVSPGTTAARPARAPRAPKRTPPNKIIHAFEGMSVTSPKRVIGTSREDTDFDALADYAPPTSTLPGHNAKALKTDWKGQMLDLSHDPHRHLLHEAEVHLAATLRLSCATYLCSKRRIFMARLEALRIGKEFRKTDSQQACKIDVNKASKLWAAYDRVGWFRPEHFTQFL